MRRGAVRAVSRSQFSGSPVGQGKGRDYYPKCHEESVEGFQPGSDVLTVSLVALWKMDFRGIRLNLFWPETVKNESMLPVALLTWKPKEGVELKRYRKEGHKETLVPMELQNPVGGSSWRASASLFPQCSVCHLAHRSCSTFICPANKYQSRKAS